eukprot:m.632560 g.632560  ORF g.632560 m.632560 type:complete len:50 (+) comp58293_c0_seq16:145-294(+)
MLACPCPFFASLLDRSSCFWIRPCDTALRPVRLSCAPPANSLSISLCLS